MHIDVEPVGEEEFDTAKRIPLSGFLVELSVTGIVQSSFSQIALGPVCILFGINGRRYVPSRIFHDIFHVPVENGGSHCRLAYNDLHIQDRPAVLIIVHFEFRYIDQYISGRFPVNDAFKYQVLFELPDDRGDGSFHGSSGLWPDLPVHFKPVSSLVFFYR